MRPIWKGAISLGLMNIPVSLYSATQREELKFRLLRARDLSPVNYKRVTEVDQEEVPWDQIVKGYEYEKEKFVVITEADFERVDVKATQTVDILDFVSQAEINPMFFQKPFYMEPAKGGTKAYVLLRECLNDTGKVGIAKVVIKTRQHLAAVKAQGKALLLELMHFADELVDPKTLHLPEKAELRKGELEMARVLINEMTTKWKPENYVDDYKTSLMRLIEEKIKSGGRSPARAKSKPAPTGNVIDLVEVLRKSIGAASERQQRSTRKKASHKTAAKRKRAA